jgi:UDP-N-acetyl-D-glucosamine dehydrogenase
MKLIQKIETKTAKIGIVGLGYVGLPLAVEFAKAGFCVVGLDTDERKVESINRGVSYIPDVSSSELAELIRTRRILTVAEKGESSTDIIPRLSATSHAGILGEMDCVIICVPTPLKKTKDPDIQYILAACESIAKYLHAEMLISLESSTYPGTTDELMLPMFQERGFNVGHDFYLCFSPERVDPGNPNFQTRNIPKVIGGITPECTAMGELLYRHAVDEVITVKGTRTAEMVKLLENTFRMVNIGLVNELAIMCDKMGIDIWSVIDAAKTKPFGFMPFYPGPGLGGHCIPIDPFYFSWKAKQYGLEPRFIETAGYINSQMPHYVVQKVQDALNSMHLPLNGSKIHLLGVAYKKDIDDVRESPAIDVALLLQEKGADLSYYDPYIPKINIGNVVLKSTNGGTEGFIKTTTAACVVILTDHSCIDYDQVLQQAQLIVDTRNAFHGLTDPKIVRI